MNEPAIRDPLENEMPKLAKLWHDSWHEAHDDLVPVALCRIRTLESFSERISHRFHDLRASGPLGAPDGFCIIDGDELDQLFVAPQARGTGVAARLMADAEMRMNAKGVEIAWLACAIGNMRAARFYEKCGWQLARTQTVELKGAGGGFPLEIWRYEKRLAG
ncbi:MAG: GNAT family N-acetyltransferase [Oricola sp.]